MQTQNCKVCFEEIKDKSFHHFFNNTTICCKCLAKFRPKFKEFMFEGVKVLSIYEYKESIKEKLFLFKGCFDYELYSETTARYTTVLVSYFIEDDIVMYCDSDEMMDDPGKLIGNDNLADLRNNNDLDELYVRNEMMGIDYHIIKEMSSYEEYLAD